MSSLYGVRDCHIEAPVRMNELLIQGWGGGGPSVARGDHLRRHGRSGGTKYSAVDGPGGPILGGTNYRVTD